MIRSWPNGVTAGTLTLEAQSVRILCRLSLSRLAFQLAQVCFRPLFPLDDPSGSQQGIHRGGLKESGRRVPRILIAIPPPVAAGIDPMAGSKTRTEFIVDVVEREIL